MKRNPLVFHAPEKLLSGHARKAMGAYVKRIPALGETPPARNSIWERPAYVPPAASQTREGSQVAFTLLSKGLST